MAIPAQSLSGSEVLRCGSINTQSGASSSTDSAFKFDGTPGTAGTDTHTVPANHIITITNIIFCENGGNLENFSLWAVSSSVESRLLTYSELPAKATFSWNDRFSLIGGDKLLVNIEGTGPGNIDIWYSYIDQSWV